MTYKENTRLFIGLLLIFNLTLLLGGKKWMEEQFAQVEHQYAELEQQVIRIETLIFDDEEVEDE